jgi:hypothetical protein
MSENSVFIILGIIFRLPFSIIGGIIISWNLINISKLIFLPIWLKLSVIRIIFLSILIFYFIFIKICFYKNNIFLWFFRNMWFLPLSYNISLTKINLIVSSIFFKFIEIRWSELIIFNYVNNLINNISLRKFLDYLSYIYIIQIIEIFIIIFIFIKIF